MRSSIFALSFVFLTACGSSKNSDGQNPDKQTTQPDSQSDRNEPGNQNGGSQNGVPNSGGDSNPNGGNAAPYTKEQLKAYCEDAWNSIQKRQAGKSRVFSSQFFNEHGVLEVTQETAYSLISVSPDKYVSSMTTNGVVGEPMTTTKESHMTACQTGLPTLPENVTLKLEMLEANVKKDVEVPAGKFSALFSRAKSVMVIDYRSQDYKQTTETEILTWLDSENSELVKMESLVSENMRIGADVNVTKKYRSVSELVRIEDIKR